MRLFLPVRFQLEPLSVLSGIPAGELRAMISTSASQGALVDAFAARYRAINGKERWAEKSPQNVQHVPWILDRFPEARIVHAIRDGRDVVCSARDHGERRWIDGRWVWSLDRKPIAWHARAWVRDTGLGLRYRGHPQMCEVRYEDLVTSPRATMERLCEALGVPFVPAMLLPAEPGDTSGPRDRGPILDSSVGRWRRDLTPDEQREVTEICGDRLRELGYEM
jgi:protein-tyrosine sulfotransferase